jgi:hypothetical protein
MRKAFQRRLLLVLAALLVLETSSCKFSEAFRLAKATEELHRLLKQSRFREIYQGASPMLKSNLSEEEFVRKLSEIKSRVGEIKAIEKADYGIVKERKLQASKIFAEMHGVTGTNASCMELTHWILEDREIMLYGYECIPKDN